MVILLVPPPERTIYTMKTTCHVERPNGDAVVTSQTEPSTTSANTDAILVKERVLKPRMWSGVVAKTVLVVCMAFVGPLAANAPSADAGAGAGSFSLASGESLSGSQVLMSSSGQYKLAMQGDGNFVLYTGQRALWQTKTYPNPGARVIMQTDGNLVVYNASGGALWASGTAGHSGASLAVQNDGNVVVYATNGQALWNTGTTSSSLAPGDSLSASQYLNSPNRLYQLAMQGDGNFVLYTGQRALWQTKTYPNPGARVIMQTDGNLVVYNASGGALWASGTAGHAGASLFVQNDGNVVIYGSTGQALWNTGTWNTTTTGRTWGQTRSYNGFPAGQCTWGASDRFHAATGTYPNVTGNAKDWGSSARSRGWTVVAGAQTRSIVVFQPYVNGADPTYGHVAWVDSVEGRSDGLWVHITEMNWAGPYFSTRVVKDLPGMAYILVP